MLVLKKVQVQVKIICSICKKEEIVWAVHESNDFYEIKDHPQGWFQGKGWIPGSFDVFCPDHAI